MATTYATNRSLKSQQQYKWLISLDITKIKFLVTRRMILTMSSSVLKVIKIWIRKV